LKKLPPLDPPAKTFYFFFLCVPSCIFVAKIVYYRVVFFLIFDTITFLKEIRRCYDEM